jgi:murein DD-endopeptidase MepM/ murein hydrolase activator NlpD
MRRAFNGTYPVTNPFGIVDEVAYARYPGKKHPGEDYGLPANTPLVAGMSGQISRNIFTGWYGKGNELVISNANTQRRYGHMNRIDVQTALGSMRAIPLACQVIQAMSCRSRARQRRTQVPTCTMS